MELVTIRNFGFGHILAAVFDGEQHVGTLEYVSEGGLIQKLLSLDIRPQMRGQGYARAIVRDVIQNPSAEVLNIKRGMRGFWRKVMPHSVTFKK